MPALWEIGLWNAAMAAGLALVAAAVSRLLRRPALTHMLWLLVLLKLVTPPLIPLSLTLPSSVDSPAPLPDMAATVEADEADAVAVESAALDDAPTVALAEPSDAVAFDLPWDRWAALAWLTGSVLWAAWAAFHVLRFRRVLRRARLGPGRLQQEAEELARRLGLRRCPVVWLVPGAVSPMVWALGRRPCLLFPAGLLERLDGPGRAALLAHELAHVRRRDHWVRLLELIATGLYWWHPALWWARRELHEAEEQCCDAWAVWALGGEARPYALALLQAVAFVSHVRLPLPVGASGIGQVSHLKRRLAMVMQGKTSRSLSWASLGLVFGVSVLLLPLFPARGQVPAPRDPEVADPAAGPTDRNRQIAELKRALKMLEDAQAQDSGRAGQIQAQLKELDRAIAVKKKELAELQAKAEHLRVQLQQSEKDTRARDAYSRAVQRGIAPSTPADRVSDLEKKLDRIQKELEELRRELRPGRTTPPRGPAGFPGRPPVREEAPNTEPPGAPPAPPAPRRAGPPVGAPPGGLAPPAGAPPAPPAPPTGGVPPAPDLPPSPAPLPPGATPPPALPPVPVPPKNAEPTPDLPAPARTTAR
jgi:beta-lactamase regulating signal transducer with metallopeptidase domain